MGTQARVTRWLQVEPGEGWPLLFLFARAALLALSLVASSTFQSALFLSHFDASILPWHYAATALATLGVALPFSAYQKRRGPVKTERALTLFLVGGMGLGFLIEPLGSARWAIFLFTIWVQLPAIFGNLTLWDTAIGAFEGRRARILLPIIAAGSNLGAILGGQIAALFAGTLGNNAVLPVLMVVGVLTAWLASRPNVAAQPDKGVEPQGSQLADGLRTVRSNALGRNITLVILFSTALFLGVDFVFKKSLRDLYDADADGMSRFLGYFYMGLNLVVFAVQTAAMGRLMRALGVKVMTLATPALVLSGLGVAVVSGGILPALLAAVLAGSLRYTFFLNSRNQLATPLTALQKSAAGFLNRTLVTPVGTVLAGLLFLPIRGQSAQVLAAASSVFGVAMFVAAWRAAVAYKAELADSLARRTLQVGWGEEGFSLPDPSVLSDLEAKTRCEDPQEALFAASLLAGWGELLPKHLERPLQSGLEAGTNALALSQSLNRADQESLLRKVVEKNPNLALRMDALGRARALNAAWLGDGGAALWASSDIEQRGLGAVALANLDGRLDLNELLEVAQQLASGKGFLGALRQRLAAWVLLAAPQELHDDAVRLGYTEATPAMRRAFVTAIGSLRVCQFYPLLEEAVMDPHCGQEAIRTLALTGHAPLLAQKWMSDPSKAVRVGALLVASAHGNQNLDPLLDASLQHGRLWYLALGLIAADRSHSPLPTANLQQQIEESLKRGALLLAYAALKSKTAEERLLWDAESGLVLQACFCWFRRTSPLWSARLLQIEYTLPKADKRSRNAAMELLEEFARGGREWFVATLDLRMDLILAGLRQYLGGVNPTSLPQAMAISKDPLLIQLASLCASNKGAPMTSLDPVLFQKALTLRTSGFFKEVATDVVLEIASRAQEVSLKRNQVLFQEGDPPDGLYFVLSGELDVWMHGRVLNHMIRGSVLGEIALLDKGPRTAKLVAAEDSSLLKISSGLFDEIMETYPGVAKGVISTLVEYVRRQSTPQDPSHAPSMSLFQLSET